MIQIYNENVFETISKVDNGSIDLIIIDPIFSLHLENFIALFSKCTEKLKKNGSLYLFSDWKNQFRFYNAIGNNKLHFLNHITWSRMSPGAAKKRYKNSKEEILYFVKDKDNYTFNKQFRKITGKQVLPYKNADGSPRGWFYDESTGERTRWAEVTNVWCYSRPGWSAKEKVEHTMQKPLMLSDRIILTSSNEGDNILDCFAGSGSFAVSCKNLNRNYVGFEIEKDYVKIIKNRLKRGY